jgi:hypothetical protein
VLTIGYDSAEGVTLIWTAQAGRSYRVEYKNELAESSWTALPDVVLAESDTAWTVDGTIGALTQRFYRIVLLP